MNSVSDCQLANDLVALLDLLLEIGNLPIAGSDAFSSTTCSACFASRQELGAVPHPKTRLRPSALLKCIPRFG